MGKLNWLSTNINCHGCTRKLVNCPGWVEGLGPGVPVRPSWSRIADIFVSGSQPYVKTCPMSRNIEADCALHGAREGRSLWR